MKNDTNKLAENGHRAAVGYRNQAKPEAVSACRKNDELLDFIHQLSTWHAKRVAHLRTIQDGVKKGTTLKIGDDDEVGTVMTARDVGFFQCGLEAGLVELGKLPFTVSQDADEAIEGSDV